MIRLSTITAMLAIAVQGGCSTKLVTHQENVGRYTRLPDDTVAGLGADYGLPMLQFQLSVQRKLLQCEDESGGTKIRFLIKVESQPVYVVGERFALDYEALSGWSKTSALELQTYDSGVLKSLNAEVADQTKGIIGDVIKSGISLLSLAQGVPLANKALPPPGSQPSGYVCTAAAKSALELGDQTTKMLKSETSRLMELTDDVTRMERLAGLGALTEDAKSALDTAQKAVGAQVKRVSGLEKELASLVDRVSVAEQIVWPQLPTQRTLDAAPNVANRSKLEKLFEIAPGGYAKDEWEAMMKLRARLVPVAATVPIVPCDENETSCHVKQVKPSEAAGLFYRTPVPARLLVCEIATDEECNLGASGVAVLGASGVVVSASVMAPQLGPLRLLPYRNGVFQNNVLKVVFRENGSISTLNYDEKSARGADLAEAVSGGLDQVVAFRDARQAEKQKRAAAARAEDDAKRKAVLDDLDVKSQDVVMFC